MLSLAVGAGPQAASGDGDDLNMAVAAHLGWVGAVQYHTSKASLTTPESPMMSADIKLVAICRVPYSTFNTQM